MTSAADPAPLLWITGLSGVGKSTLAAAVVDALRARGIAPLLLDGDAVRHALDAPGETARYDEDARRRRAWRLARLATMAAQQGVPVVVATISLFHAVQQWLRDSNPRYVELLLTAPLDVLRARDPALYGGSDVVGVDQPAQFPLRPDCVLAQDYAGTTAHLDAALSLWDASR